MKTGLLSGLIGFSLLVLAPACFAETDDLPDPLTAGWKGKPVCEHLYEDSTKRILRCTFPPGVGHERHYHVANFGYTIAGGLVRITSEEGVREVTLTAGKSYTSGGTAWHEVVNIGDTTVIYLLVETK